MLHVCDLSCDIGLVKTDDEILSLISRIRPRVIAIDSPLSYARSGSFRMCDLEARRRGFMVLPLSMPSMAKLTARGVRLKQRLCEKGYEVIEVFPTGAFRALGLTPPKRDLAKAIEGLRSLGLRISDIGSVHEVDAVMAAYVAYLYVKGEVELLGDSSEGVIVMPKRR